MTEASFAAASCALRRHSSNGLCIFEQTRFRIPVLRRSLILCCPMKIPNPPEMCSGTGLGGLALTHFAPASISLGRTSPCDPWTSRLETAGRRCPPGGCAAVLDTYTRSFDRREEFRWSM